VGESVYSAVGLIPYIKQITFSFQSLNLLLLLCCQTYITNPASNLYKDIQELIYSAKYSSGTLT